MFSSEAQSTILTTKMVLTSTFPWQNPPMVFYPNHIAQTNSVSPTMRWHGLKRGANQVNRNNIFRSGNTSKYILTNQRYLSFVPTLAAESADYIPDVAPSLSDVVKKFYTSINEKKLTQLQDLISRDCLLEDSVFPHSFQGKQEVMSFISQLVESMGENVHFRLGNVCEGNKLIASLDWHLEWKEDQIPFSKGCSIFQCSIEDERLVIRKVQIITESPIKPGKLALGLLKILASIFDEFPKAAKWFLTSPQTIFKVVLKIYSLLFAPIVTPIIAFYTTLWTFISRLLGYIITILHIIAKLFNKKSSNGNTNNSDLITD